MKKSATFRFYEELNDFLPGHRRKVAFPYEFTGQPAVKDAIESLGVPHSEVDVILANNQAVDFYYQLQGDDRIAVYPVFESFEVRELARLRATPLRNPRFIVDANLGKLAKFLRLLGFDTLYDRNYADKFIVNHARESQRIILTRDKGLLKHKEVTHGFWIRNDEPKKQVKEVLARLHLHGLVKPLSRCLACNHPISQVEKQVISARVPARIGSFYDEFYECKLCQRVYWKGSHYQRMMEFSSTILDGLQQSQ